MLSKLARTVVGKSPSARIVTRKTIVRTYAISAFKAEGIDVQVLIVRCLLFF